MVPSERDLFANFERMRREMDELFGEVLERRLTPRRHDGFMPAVDVYYAGDPPRAVVRADLAGIDPSDVELEIRGRELVLSGLRRPPPTTPSASTSSSRSSTARSGASCRWAPRSKPRPRTRSTRTGC